MTTPSAIGVNTRWRRNPTVRSRTLIVSGEYRPVKGYWETEAVHQRTRRGRTAGDGVSLRVRQRIRERDRPESPQDDADTGRQSAEREGVREKPAEEIRLGKIREWAQQRHDSGRREGECTGQESRSLRS